MVADRSIEFFEAQFRREVAHEDVALNSFEQAALPHLRGDVLDFGCGMGHLSVAAARRGCHVVALDASHTAIEHLRQRAAAEQLAIKAQVEDLREYQVSESFDAIVTIGVLMCFDRPRALRCLGQLQAQVRTGGVAVVNVLLEGTTYMDLLDPVGYCLFGRDELQQRFGGWEILSAEYRDFDLPGNRIKSFITLIARKPSATDAT